jgi:two-component system sensor histidine kinase FlrB
VATIALDRVGGALVVCDEDGCVLGGSPTGKELLIRMGVDLATLPAPLTAELWDSVVSHELGEAAQWRSGANKKLMLSCTRHRLGDDAWLLILSEISQKQTALAYRLHQQRLETLGRIVATAVHDLRAPLSSIVFNIDVLARPISAFAGERSRDVLNDLRSASLRMGETIDCLLDFVRLGPPLPCEVSLKEVLSRVQSLLRPQLRVGPHQLVIAVDKDVRVVGNLLTIEQIFLNLVVNSLEAGAAPITVKVSTRIEGKSLRVLVEDDGPGIRADHRQLVFEPMFSTKDQGVGFGLTSARESARSLGGDLQLVRWNAGTAFAVLLPMSKAQGDA